MPSLSSLTPKNRPPGSVRMLDGWVNQAQGQIGLASRASKDVDGLVRGDIDTFVARLDETLDLPRGPLDPSRTAIEVIETPARVIKPSR